VDGVCAGRVSPDDLARVVDAGCGGPANAIGVVEGSVVVDGHGTGSSLIVSLAENVESESRELSLGLSCTPPWCLRRPTCPGIQRSRVSFPRRASTRILADRQPAGYVKRITSFEVIVVDRARKKDPEALCRGSSWEA
jgi:hypothetical protein